MYPKAYFNLQWLFANRFFLEAAYWLFPQLIGIKRLCNIVAFDCPISFIFLPVIGILY